MREITQAIEIYNFSLICFTVMIAENISLGILSLPSAVATLGMAP
jgi:hypothetical protein